METLSINNLTLFYDANEKETADLGEKVRHITCHELTYAFTAHLKLPVWLREGLAMVAVDKFVGRPTVKDSTIGSLDRPSGQANPRGYRGLSTKDPDAFIYPFIRGYWITRYLKETQAGLLESVLAQRYSHEALESKVATACGMGREEFWQRIDPIVAAHFREKGIKDKQ